MLINFIAYHCLVMRKSFEHVHNSTPDCMVYADDNEGDVRMTNCKCGNKNGQIAQRWAYIFHRTTHTKYARYIKLLRETE